MSKKQSKYRVRNWSEYNAGLKQRGSITVWISEDVLATWLNEKKTGNRGASQTYSNLAIETVVMIKSIYGLAGGQAVGFTESIFDLIGVAVAVPDHSTLSRRLGELETALAVVPKEGASHVVIGSRYAVKGKGRPVSTG